MKKLTNLWTPRMLTMEIAVMLVFAFIFKYMVNHRYVLERPYLLLSTDIT